jgi:DNA-binding Lrp family transcriptional regulator
MRFRVLLTLRDGRRTIHEVARMAGVDVRQAGDAVEGLAGRGLVLRSGQRIGLTARGGEAIRAMMSRDDSVPARKLPTIASDDEVDPVEEMTRSIVALRVVHDFCDLGMVPRESVRAIVGCDRRIRRVMEDLRAAGFEVEVKRNRLAIYRGEA